MHPQLTAIIEEFQSARARLDALAAGAAPHQWAIRPDPARWSISECVGHLNLTSEVYLPLLREGLARARSLGRPAPARYRRDLVGWLLWRTLGPPVRFRTRTAASFVPTATESPAELIATFARLQQEQIDCVRAAEGLPIDRVRSPSPFAKRVEYNLFSALSIVPRHQHRHLWQAEQVALALAAAPAG